MTKVKYIMVLSNKYTLFSVAILTVNASTYELLLYTFSYNYIITFMRENIVSIYPPWKSLFLHYSAFVVPLRFRVLGYPVCKWEVGNFSKMIKYCPRVIFNMLDATYLCYHATLQNYVYMPFFFLMSICNLCKIYGTPNSQKWAKHSFTVDKQGLSTVNYSLRIVNYS
jgi:hypothetical protein